ncbi:MAG TPA: transporter substrate-binding domain-containing protein [Oligoflexus sp.]|uniref:substrate-binding periplasmic protein n=1 Tax=Oligoflexus sp. TaxID=1971216 RepID=UPI002D48C56C|nr:transporter substrate-binding domain-containing protein [Oligoflexus sp.]HYX35982.1 transporter substrate-binding domain-containing protein [Oligoflexus sp.]
MRFLLLAVFLSTSLGAAESQPPEIRVCFEDKRVFPLYNTPGTEDTNAPGILIDFAHHISKKHGVKLNLMRRPAIACRVLMKTGNVDIYGIVSYMKEREEWAIYPRLPNGELDANTVFKRAGYFLYSRQDKPLPWDGKSLETLKGLRIGTSEGYSINDELKKAGARVESFKSVDAIFTRLMDKQLDGAALHPYRIDKKLNMGLRKYEVPLKMNDYYFTCSKAFYRDHKTFCEKVWKDSIFFEETSEGKKAMSDYDAVEDFPVR